MSESVSSIVVGFDYSPSGFLALLEGFRIASVFHPCEPHVIVVGRATSDLIYFDRLDLTLSMASAALMVREDIETEARKAAIRGQARGLARIVTHVHAGDPAEEILRLANVLSASAIVLGASHGILAPGIPHDATSERVRRASPCAVHGGSCMSSELDVTGHFPEWERTRRIVA